MEYDTIIKKVRRNNYRMKVLQEGGTFIDVKVLDTPEHIVEKYGFNQVIVHVGMSRRQLERMTREEANKRNYDYYMGYSGYDECSEERKIN